jgi:hypothetical protein
MLAVERATAYLLCALPETDPDFRRHAVAVHWVAGERWVVIHNGRWYGAGGHWVGDEEHATRLSMFVALDLARRTAQQSIRD